MIAMFLGFGEVAETDKAIFGGSTAFAAISIILLLVALICVPLMLCVKPCYMRHKLKGQHHVKDDTLNSYHSLDNDEIEERKEGLLPDSTKQHSSGRRSEIDLDQILAEEGGSDHEDIGEIFIHQLIETIEFVLGTVSNTASYLRLWALSLAHGQLAEVFYEKLMEVGLGDGGQFFLAFLIFPAFFTITFSVLMCMDSLECFLHTLRLHWVEFQNKFYHGGGYAFIPFSYDAILREELKRGD